MRPGGKGYALMMVLVFVLAIFMVVAATSGMVSHNLSSGSHAERVLKARYAAATGLRKALVQLSRDPSWEPSSSPFTGVLAFDPSLGYRVDVRNNYGETTPIIEPGVNVAPGEAWLRSVGTVDGEEISGGFGLLETRLVKPPVIFPNAIHLTKAPLVATGVIDSYSSDPFIPVTPTSVKADEGLNSPALNIVGDVIVPDASKPTASSYTGNLQIDPTRSLPIKFRTPDAVSSDPPIWDGDDMPVESRLVWNCSRRLWWP